MTQVFNQLRRVAKAITAGIVAGGSAYVAVQADGITQNEWFYLVGAVAVTAFLTWLVPNKSANTTAEKPPLP